ncbi:fimbrial assembly protein [Methylomonas methanica]|uniref:Fimbrial assembly protein n=1 Tax=Methylomonas methanica TaxID=421 RepID=A0A177MFX6_METMH|nr:PilN domain-containing protein [Methylomonas methanica]OAI04676.1 fimbrial assembly protein [Methylomonas methanica]
MNLQTSIDFDLKRFFQWWGRELAFLVPNRLRSLLTDRSGALVFSAADADFQINFYRDTEQQTPMTWRLDSDIADSYQSLKAQNPDFDKAECILRLDNTQALKKIVYLPAAAQENLQQVVGFELDRYTPFKAEQVYFAAIPLGKTEHGQIEVLLVFTPKTLLDEQLGKLQALGIQPLRVDYGHASTVCPVDAPAYNLLPERYQPRGNALAQAMHWLLNGLLLLLFLAVLIWPVWQEGQAVDVLKNHIKTLEKETRVIEEQQHEIDALRQQTQRLIDIKTQSPALVAVLNELSTLLKDDSWLTHFQFADKRLQIQGQSPAASSLIGLLESSGFFSNVSFVSPLTQDKATGRERFQISMDVSPPPVEPGSDTDATTASDPDPSEPTANGESEQ